MHGRADAMKARGETVIDFSIAISHFPAPEAVLDTVRQALHQTPLPYTAVGGDAGVRARLAHHVAAAHGIPATPADILITNGAKQALYQALYSMTDPGDAVIIFKPYWPAYVATCQLLELEPLLIDLPEQMTDAVLDSLPPARVLIVNNPHNPTGKVLSEAEVACIAAWLRRSGAQAIVDESYGQLVFEGRHISLAARAGWREPGIVTLYSVSQSHAMMGWRAGFAVAPAPLVAAMETLQGPITAAAPMLTQLALAAAMESGQPAAMLADYRQRRDMVLDLVHGLPWLSMSRPASGAYLWADVSPLTRDTIGFCEQLLNQRGVALMPGEALGAPGHIRIGYIGGDVPTMLRGVQATIDFGNQLYQAA